jgi:hypothetical protein
MTRNYTELLLSVRNLVGSRSYAVFQLFCVFIRAEVYYVKLA